MAFYGAVLSWIGSVMGCCGPAPGAQLYNLAPPADRPACLPPLFLAWAHRFVCRGNTARTPEIDHQFPTFVACCRMPVTWVERPDTKLGRPQSAREVDMTPVKVIIMIKCYSYPLKQRSETVFYIQPQGVTGSVLLLAAFTHPRRVQTLNISVPRPVSYDLGGFM